MLLENWQPHKLVFSNFALLRVTCQQCWKLLLLSSASRRVTNILPIITDQFLYSSFYPGQKRDWYTMQCGTILTRISYYPSYNSASASDTLSWYQQSFREVMASRPTSKSISPWLHVSRACCWNGCINTSQITPWRNHTTNSKSIPPNTKN